MAMQSLLSNAYSLDEFARVNDIALTTVRREIESGRLVARKIGRRTIITPEDATAWRDHLPRVQPRERQSANGEAELLPSVGGTSHARGI